MAQLTVTSSADSGVGSLRAAIAIAQSGDTIQFDSILANKTITLTSGQLEIGKNLTIDAKNAPGLTISGNNKYRVFDIKWDQNSNPTQVTLRYLTIINGKTTGSGEDGAGAGIRTAALSKLVVENSKFKNNYANGEGGGALWGGWKSTVTVTNSQFEGNQTSANSPRGGGAIAVTAEGSLTVTGSTFTQNKSSIGGAINTLLGGLSVKNSTFTKNNSTRGGGAIYVDGASLKDNGKTSGTIEISNSRFDANTAVGEGGAMMLFVYDADQIIMENSTIINNKALADAQGFALGGGLRIDNGKFSIRNTTFANNQAATHGGGLYMGDTTGATIDNSLFYGNRAESADGKSGLGGGIFLVDTTHPIKISNTTVANNYAAFEGGGFWGGSLNTTLRKTLAVDNFANQGGGNWINHHTNKVYKDEGENFQSLSPRPDSVKITAGVTLIDTKLQAFKDNGTAVQTPPLPTNPLVTGGAVAIDITLPSDLVDARPKNIATLKSTPDNILALQDAPSSAKLQFNLSESNTKAVNEIGVFIADDPSGRVNGIAPGQNGYLQAVLSKSQVIFSALSNNEFPSLRSTRQLSFEGNKTLGFYLVQNNTTDTVLSSLAAGRTPPNVFFSIPSANANNANYLQVSELGNNTFNLAWEDGFERNEFDFKDLLLTVQLTTTSDAKVLGTKLQGQQQREVIDLTDRLTGLVPAEIIVNSEAAYANTFGFYPIDDPTGRIGNLLPGSPGYAQAAISNRLDLEAGLVALPSGKLLAPFFISNGTPEEFLSKNPNNQKRKGNVAYFAYIGANPDGVDHIRLLGDNVFGFEDRFGGGDRDFNDLLIKVNFT